MHLERCGIRIKALKVSQPLYWHLCYIAQIPPPREGEWLYFYGIRVKVQE
jgi:hypothetical protein